MVIRRAFVGFVHNGPVRRGAVVFGRGVPVVVQGTPVVIDGTPVVIDSAPVVVDCVPVVVDSIVAVVDGVAVMVDSVAVMIYAAPATVTVLMIGVLAAAASAIPVYRTTLLIIIITTNLSVGRMTIEGSVLWLRQLRRWRYDRGSGRRRPVLFHLNFATNIRLVRFNHSCAAMTKANLIIKYYIRESNEYLKSVVA